MKNKKGFYKAFRVTRKRKINCVNFFLYCIFLVINDFVYIHFNDFLKNNKFTMS